MPDRTTAERPRRGHFSARAETLALLKVSGNDKCIPAFTDLAGCAICIAECPWMRPTVRPKLLATMARRLGQPSSEE